MSHTPNTCTSHPTSPPRARDERGFTVIEVVVAIMLIVVVMTSMAIAVAGGSKVQGAAKVRARMDATAQAVMESLRSDRSWMDTCTPAKAPTTCPELSPRFTPPASNILKDSSLKVTFELVTVNAVPVDSPGDGRDTDPDGDVDGVVPDYYDVTLTLKVPDADVKRLYNVHPLTMRTTIDKSGRVARGSVLVAICKVNNQVDARMAIQGCAGGTGSFVGMKSSCGAGIAAIYCSPFNDLKNDIFVDGMWPYYDDNRPSIYVNVEAMNDWFSLDGPLDGPNAGTAACSPSSARHIGEGRYLCENMPVGQYDVNYSPPAGFEMWKSHVLPANNRLSVQFHQRSSALLISNPKPRGKISFEFKRKVNFMVWSFGYENRDDLDDEWLGCTGDPYDAGGETCEKIVKHTLVMYTQPSMENGWVDKPRTETWPGAAGSAVLSIRPAPYGRAIDESSSPYKVISKNVVVTAKDNFWGSPNPCLEHSKLTPSGPVVQPCAGVHTKHSVSLEPLQTGLNTPPMVSKVIGPRSIGSPDDPDFDGNYTWVDPRTGHISNGVGIVNKPNPTITYLGRGECYMSMYQYKYYHHSGWITGELVDTGEYHDANYMFENFGGTPLHYVNLMLDKCPNSPMGCVSQIYWRPTNTILSNGSTICSLHYESCDIFSWQRRTRVWVSLGHWVDTDPAVDSDLDGDFGNDQDSWVDDSYMSTSAWNQYQYVSECEGKNPPHLCSDFAAVDCGPVTHQHKLRWTPSPTGKAPAAAATKFQVGA